MPATPAFWGSFQVNVHTAGVQTEPSITQLSTGHILVVWTDRDNGGAVGGAQPEYDIIGRVFDPTGVPVTGEILLNQVTANFERDPSVVALPNGGFALGYWANISGGPDRVYIQEHSFNPATSSITYLNAQFIQISETGSTLQLASNAAGMVVGTYVFRADLMDPNSLSYAQAFTYDSVSNALTGPFSLYTGSAGSGTMVTPDVVALTNGNFAVAIQDPNAGTIAFQLRDMFGNAIAGDTVHTGSSLFQPQIAALTGGRFVVSYMANPGTSDVHFRVYDAAGTAVGAAIQAGQVDQQLHSQDRNFVFGLPDGTFVVSWADQTLDQIRAQRYAVSGNTVNPVGDEFVIGTQDNPAVSLGYHEIEVLDDGRFAVSWGTPEDIRLTIFDPRDTSGTDVYGPDSRRIGTPGADTMSSAAKFVHGWAGNDTITEIAAAGSNTLTGDAGNDTLKVRSSIDNDIFQGGAGSDTIDFSLSAQRGLNIDLTAGKVRFGSKVETISGFEHIIGTSGADTLRGSAGANTLKGGAGNDTYTLESGADNVIDSAGIDTVTSTINRTLSGLYAEVENLTLLGSALKGTGNASANSLIGNMKNNTLDGAAGNDMLSGLAGNDTLIGGLGKDTLTGGVGSDIFKFTSKTHSVAGANADRITDFDDGGAGDRIDISGLAGPKLTYMHDAAFSGAGQVRINDVAGADVVVEVNLTGASGADFSIRLVGTTLASMDEGDFVL